MRGVKQRTSVFVGDDLCFSVLACVSTPRLPPRLFAGRTYTGSKGNGAVRIAKGYAYGNPL